MPIYEYYCENCNEEIEVLQKFSDAPLVTCPSCHSDSLKKKTSMAAFHLKGGGWYKDGYGNGNGTPSETGKKDNGSSNEVKTQADATPDKSTKSVDDKGKKETKTTPADSAPKSKAS